MAQAAHSDAYITISLDKTGKVIRVQQGDRYIEPRKGKPGPTQRGDSTAGCEEVIKVLHHELLTSGKKKEPGKPSDPGKPPTPPTPPGTDPCCYRDQQTGEEWCWC